MRVLSTRFYCIKSLWHDCLAHAMILRMFEILNYSLKELVIAYRGTEGVDKKDWSQNLFSERKQSDSAFSITKKISATGV